MRVTVEWEEPEVPGFGSRAPAERHGVQIDRGLYSDRNVYGLVKVGGPRTFSLHAQVDARTENGLMLLAILGVVGDDGVLVPKFWRTTNRREIAIADMEDTHLSNAIAMVEREGRGGTPMHKALVAEQAKRLRGMPIPGKGKSSVKVINRKERQMDSESLKNSDLKYWDTEYLVGLAADADQLAAQYSVLGITAPAWIAKRKAEIVATIKEKRAAEQQAERKKLMAEIDSLKTTEEKRKAAEERLAAVDAEIAASW